MLHNVLFGLTDDEKLLVMETLSDSDLIDKQPLEIIKSVRLSLEKFSKERSLFKGCIVHALPNYKSNVICVQRVL
jgi:hypothetical protein